MCDVVGKRSERGRPRRWKQGQTRDHRRSMHSGKKPGSNGLDITLDAANLSGKENLGVRFHLQVFAQQARPVDIGIPMNLPVTQELRILETGDQSQNSSLFPELEMVLKSDEVILIGAKVFLPQLDDCVWNFPGTWIPQPDRFHRPEPQCVAPAPRYLFNRKTAFEVIQFLPILFFH